MKAPALMIQRSAFVRTVWQPVVRVESSVSSDDLQNYNVLQIYTCTRYCTFFTMQEQIRCTLNWSL